MEKNSKLIFNLHSDRYDICEYLIQQAAIIDAEETVCPYKSALSWAIENGI